MLMLPSTTSGHTTTANSNNNNNTRQHNSNECDKPSFLAAVFENTSLNSLSSHHSRRGPKRGVSPQRKYQQHKHLRGAGLLFAPSTATTTTVSAILSLDHSSHHNSSSSEWTDPRILKAQRAVQTSLTAILDVLEHQGVSIDTIQELRHQVHVLVDHHPLQQQEEHSHNSITTTATRLNTCWIHTLTQAQEYAKVCFIQSSSTTNQNQDHQPSLVMMACLLRAAWETVCHYQSLQYRAAYNNFHTLRRQQESNSQQQQQQQHTVLLQQARIYQMQQAEQVCMAQKQCILATAWEKHVGHS